MAGDYLHSAKAESTRPCQACEYHTLEAVRPGGADGISWIREAEIGRREVVGGVFQGGDGLVGAVGGVVDRTDRDRERARCGAEAIGEGVLHHTGAVEIRGWGVVEVAAADRYGAVGHGAEAGDAQGIALGIAVVGDEAGQADRDRSVFRDAGAIGHRQGRCIDRIDLIEELQQPHPHEHIGAIVAIDGRLEINHRGGAVEGSTGGGNAVVGAVAREDCTVQAYAAVDGVIA